MKLDWQHVVILAVGLGCATACILLGHGNTLIQVLAGIGGASGAAAVLKASPLAPSGDK